MSKKKYIFTETGEKRYPKAGEYFFNNINNIVDYAFIDFFSEKKKILKLEVKKESNQKAVKG